ncbi:hypothetical protein FACS1894190_14740 [Spirochaetia bacterium]|nr:hypothetical protein FACS1894190_14740 [Spirochaetia bacterium]
MFSNKYISWSEKTALCNLMLSKKPSNQKIEFTDERNKLIYKYLSWFCIQTPYVNTEKFITYIKENGALEKSGGSHYVRSVFRGIPEQEESDL